MSSAFLQFDVDTPHQLHLCHCLLLCLPSVLRYEAAEQRKRAGLPGGDLTTEQQESLTAALLMRSVVRNTQMLLQCLLCINPCQLEIATAR